MNSDKYVVFLLHQGAIGIGEYISEDFMRVVYYIDSFEYESDFESDEYKIIYYAEPVI